MNPRLFLGTAAISSAFLWLACPIAATAQVAVWPGSVVAPFVHVEWNDRWVHVCAPFVNLTVDVPRYCGCRPRCYENWSACASATPPIGESYSRPTRRQLAKSATELFDSLEQFQTANSWRHYLALDTGQTLSAEQLSSSGTSNERLVEALRHFDAANRQQQFQQITTLPKFQQLHTLVANYVAQQPRSGGSDSKSASMVLTGAAEASVSLSARAVDIARAESLTSVPRLSDSALKPKLVEPKLTHPSVEELPPPADKGGV